MSHPRFWALPLFLSLLLFPFFHTRTALAAPVDETGRRWPLAEPVSVLRGFDPPEQRWLPGHLGVDLAAEPGREVYAAAPGRVHFAGPVAGIGVVSVAHGDVRTTYLPVDASVARGDPVGPDPIGTLSEEPFHCRDRPCLHWGLLRGDTYLDPLSLLGRGEIRLLPLDPPGPGPATPSGEGAALRPARRSRTWRPLPRPIDRAVENLEPPVRHLHGCANFQSTRPPKSSTQNKLTKSKIRPTKTKPRYRIRKTDTETRSPTWKMNKTPPEPQKITNENP
ncbi:M23 family metallopeptidase [Nocardiopsis alba]|uniref:M23 family metallopeptidase n=1 Tax=Nocardiopsis alba TaxID=53437 RepID=UPI0033BAA43F